jgi:GT2 family glycosyltransferase
MKIFIATPMYGGMCTGQYASGLVDLITLLSAKGHKVVYSKVYNESLITRARNTLANEFLKTDADYMLFIDADQGFVASEIERMIDSDVELIGAIYPMKSINWTRALEAVKGGADIKDIEAYTGFFSANLKSEEGETITIALDKPLQVDNVATGMMLIKREVFEKMIPTSEKYAPASSSGYIEFENRVYEFFKTDIDERGVLLSEDYYFCKRWEELGGKVYAAPWVQITHFGSYEFKGSFAKSIIMQSKIENEAESKK